MIKYDHKALQASGIFIHGGHPNTMFKTLSPWVGQEVGDCSVQEEAAGAEGSPAQESHWGCRSLREGDGRRGGGEGGGTGGWEELDHQVTVYCFLEKLVGGFPVLKGAWARSYKCASCFVLIRKSPVPISPTSSLPGQNALGSPPPTRRLCWMYSASLFLVCPWL